MRVFNFSKAAVLAAALFLSTTSAFAQENGVDEFLAFRNKLGPAGSLPMGKVAINAQPQTPEELQAMIEEEAKEQRRKVIKDFAALRAAAKIEKPAPETKSSEADISADSKIVAVTVYNNLARVTRQAEVDLPAGKHNILLKGLPVTLMPDSIRAEGSAKAKVTFGSVTILHSETKGTLPSLSLDFFEEAAPTIDERNAIDVEADALSAQEEFLRNSFAQSAGPQKDGSADVKPEQLVAASKSFYAALADVLKQKEALRVKRQILDAEIMQKVKYIPAKLYKDEITAKVPLDAEGNTHLTLRVIYSVVNATWSPVYDARIETAGKGQLELIQFGSVHQKTGEDWSNVDLTLSTAQPARTASLPELKTSWVSLGATALMVPATTIPAGADPLQEWRSKAEARRMQTEEATPPPAENEMPAQDAQFQTANLNTGGYVNEYKIPGPATIVADNSETKLMIGTFPLESRLQIQIRPQLSTDAFLASHAVLKGDAPILPGPASLFRDGAFVGKLDLPLLRPGAATDIFFGVDDRVTVKHQTLKDERGQTGVISKDNSLERDVVTTVENLHKEPVDIVLSEIVPTSRDEKLKLEILESETTAGYKTDDENTKGLLRWQETLPPQGKKEFKLGWKLDWPKELTLQGL